MRYVFDPPAQPSVVVVDSEARFPIRRIFCVGRNYAKHAREMGGDPDREPPFFFSKPPDAVVDAGIDADARVPYPPDTENVHHEVELAVAIGVGGRDVDPGSAHEHIFGYAVALDLTRRDLQAQAKARGRPWAMSKGFDHSAPIAPIHPIDAVGPLSTGRIWLTVNGTLRQDADLEELIWPIPDLIARLSRTVQLAPGDLILTGTPAGVGPLLPGDRVRGGVTGLQDLVITVVEA